MVGIQNYVAHIIIMTGGYVMYKAGVASLRSRWYSAHRTPTLYKDSTCVCTISIKPVCVFSSNFQRYFFGTRFRAIQIFFNLYLIFKVTGGLKILHLNQRLDTALTTGYIITKLPLKCLILGQTWKVDKIIVTLTILASHRKT